MDFNALRHQILANINKYSEQEHKVVITKLLDFLVDINEKRDQLEIENKALFEEITKKPMTSSGDYKGKVDEIIEKAHLEANKIIEKANSDYHKIIKEANAKAEGIIEKAEEKRQEIIFASIDQIKDILEKIKLKDEEAKLYRTHILSIFRKTIFKFSDLNYYIIRSDDHDFRELLRFFNLDEKLQKICDDNIEMMKHNPEYQKLYELIKTSPEIDEMLEVKNIINDQVKIDDQNINIKEIREIKEERDIDIEDIPVIKSKPVFDKEEPKNEKKSFLDIMNQFKK